MDVIQLLKEMRFEGDKLEREVKTRYKGEFEEFTAKNMIHAFEQANILLGQITLMVDVIKRKEEYDEKARKKNLNTVGDLNDLGKKCQPLMDLLFEDNEFKASLDEDNPFPKFVIQAIRKVYECVLSIIADFESYPTKKGA